MIFNSLTFILFLVLCIALYWTLPNRARIWLIFLSGIIFYGFWRIEFVPVMMFTAFTDYYIALKIDSLPVEQNKARRRWLILSFVVNFGLLIYFKYLMFFAANLNEVAQMTGFAFRLPMYTIILPLGISFYTFESVCYTVDVYRGHLKPSKDWVLYGGFITFFPKLIAGPILRASEILHQLRSRPVFKLSFLAEGVQRILIGLFLKVVLADNIAPLVDEGFAMDPTKLTAIDVWTLAFMFGFQIYFDFSGYSHIAIGCGKMMGVTISENFNFPYFASSFRDFWKRWHISLSSWIRDYLYLPMMGIKVVNRSGSTGNIIDEQPRAARSKKDLALFATWAIMGLWHGANWTFLLWGLYHASMIFVERILKPLRLKMFRNYPIILGWCVTLPLAMLAWIPFRAQTMGQTLIMGSKIFELRSYAAIGLRENIYLINFTLLMLMIGTFLYDTFLSKHIKQFPVLCSFLNVMKYTLIMILVFTFLRPISQFIYFQF